MVEMFWCSSYQLLSDVNNHGNYTLRTIDMSQFMRLDTAAIQALNVLPNPRERMRLY